MVQRYQHVIDELRVEASRRIGDALFGPENPPSPAKSKKKKRAKKTRQQEERKPLNIEVHRFATDHATDGSGAKILPFRPPT
jgi:hypothetical protein